MTARSRNEGPLSMLRPVVDICSRQRCQDGRKYPGRIADLGG
jgi:hypothetical protein